LRGLGLGRGRWEAAVWGVAAEACFTAVVFGGFAVEVFRGGTAFLVVEVFLVLVVLLVVDVFLVVELVVVSSPLVPCR
jgi:hypothetical protein